MSETEEDSDSHITFEKGSEDFIMDALGLELDRAGYVRFEDDGYVETKCCGGATRIDRVGWFEHDEEKEVVIVHDKPSCILKETG